jgi:hypothetical protein
MDSLFSGDIIQNDQSASGSPSATNTTGAQGQAANSPPALPNPVDAALKTDTVRIGGTFTGTADVSAAWLDAWTKGFDPLSPDQKTLSLAKTNALIFFDARPSDDFRVYGSTKITYPFSTSTKVLTTTTSTNIVLPNAKIFELFADYSPNDNVYFRFGKSTVKWGVGYFWSPADVINLQPINILDPTAQREGPVNMRIMIPIHNTQDNLYFYTIFNDSNLAFDTTMLAAKAEFLLGNYEIGIGAMYRYDTAERAMLTLTGPIGDFDVFGEAMASRGSAKTFVTDIAKTGITTTGSADNRNNFYFSGSAGFSYMNQVANVSAVGQYYYNGEGYQDSTRSSLVTKANAVIATLAGTPAASTFSSALQSLIYGSGTHYAAVNITKSKLFNDNDNSSASILAVMNISDGSGIVMPSIALSVFDKVTVTIGPTFVFGPSDSEYVILAGGDVVSLSLSASVSTGSF